MEQKNKTCPHCKLEVDPKATRCPHCHGKIVRMSKAGKIAAGILGFIIILFIFTGNGDKSSTSSNAPEVTKPTYSNIQICVEAEELIKNTLKAPATAEFPTCSSISIERLENDGFRVASYVDSQNSYGALIRTDWTIVFYYTDGGTKTRTDLLIVDGETVYDRTASE